LRVRSGFSHADGLAFGIAAIQTVYAIHQSPYYYAFQSNITREQLAGSSAELRNQFTGLKTFVDACPTTADMQNYVFNYVQSNAASNIAGLTDLSGLTISDPPTQAEVQAMVDKLDELIGLLQAH
jgi:hypothetical protein